MKEQRFEIALPLGSKATKPEKKAKKVEAGITYSKWQYFPTCPFCGLEDGGKDAGEERPHETHQLNCKARQLMLLPLIQTQVGYKDGKPVFEMLPRPGTFKGEVLQRQLRYSFRKMIRLPQRDPITKALTGDYFFYCEYYFKTALVVDWVWTGKEWRPWFEVSIKNGPAVERNLQTVAETNWLSMFVRKKP